MGRFEFGGRAHVNDGAAFRDDFRKVGGCDALDTHAWKIIIGCLEFKPHTLFVGALLVSISQIQLSAILFQKRRVVFFDELSCAVRPKTLGDFDFSALIPHFTFKNFEGFHFHTQHYAKNSTPLRQR